VGLDQPQSWALHSGKKTIDGFLYLAEIIICSPYEDEKGNSRLRKYQRYGLPQPDQSLLVERREAWGSVGALCRVANQAFFASRMIFLGTIVDDSELE
jgi:hypothetical protein